ncbi:MAG: acetyltransferase [Oscillospiraceae bacterium]|nr:acetyltransferase [Oscillospiraceae bacterium]
MQGKLSKANPEPVIFIGAGGQAMSVCDSLDRENYELAGFVDEYAMGSFMGRRIYGDRIQEIPNYRNYRYFVCIGNNRDRKKWFEEILSMNLTTINVIDRTALVSDMVKLGTGNFIGKYAVVNAGVEIGDNNIINTFSLIEHGSKLGNHINLSTNSTLNGDVCVEDEAFIGSGAICNGQISIGKLATVGSGSVVIKNVEAFSTVVGVPARIIRVDEQ